MKKVHWRAVLRVSDGRKLKAWAKSVSERQVIVRSQVPLQADTDCELTIYVPLHGKPDPGEIRMRCRARESVLSSAEFQVWLRPVQLMKGAQWLQEA